MNFVVLHVAKSGYFEFFKLNIGHSSEIILTRMVDRNLSLQTWNLRKHYGRVISQLCLLSLSLTDCLLFWLLPLFLV